MTAPAYEHFAHGADIGVRGRGPTIAAAFANAARALTAVVTDLAAVRSAETVAVRCEAPDLELLFVAWLNEIVYRMAIRRMLFADFEVAVTQLPAAAGPKPGDAAGLAPPAAVAGGAGWRLEARLIGEAVDIARHQPAVEVKGATFTALQVAEIDGGWVAGCVVDV